MAKEIARQMKFLNEFEDSEPDISHKVSFQFCSELLKGKKCLDIGCWTGRFINQLKGVSGTIAGADVNENALLVAKKNNRNGEFVLSTAQHLAFKDKIFDVVTMFEVLEHLPAGHEKKVFIEVKRVLKRGGHLVLSTPNKNWFLDIFDVAHWLTGHRHYKINWLKKTLMESGFKIYKIETIGGILSVVFIPISYFLKLILRLNDHFYRRISKYFDKSYNKPGFYNIYLIAKRD